MEFYNKLRHIFIGVIIKLMATLQIYERLRKVLDEKVALEIAEAIGEAYNIFERVVTKEEFIELKQVIKELAEAQRETEKAIKGLTEAQKKTEERMDKLEEKMAELAEAQKKTEQRLNELAVAQNKTEKRLEKLIGVVDDMKVELGGISHTVGHTLEDKAIIKLPNILRERYGIELEGELMRGFLENKRGDVEEINVYGFGKKNGEKVFIIGEGKARFGKGDLKDFLKKIERYGEIYGKPFPIIITFIFSNREVEEKVKELGITYFLSYQLERS